MTHYVALIDNSDDGAFGAYFPDLPGCVAMGDTLDETYINAAEALRDWIEAVEAAGDPAPAARSPSELSKDADVREDLANGSTLALVAHIRHGRPVKANMSIDSGVLAAIDVTAKRLGVSRSTFVEQMARDRLVEYA